MDGETRNYEVAYLIRQNLPEDSVVSEAGKITGIIQDAHGIIGRIEEPKSRRLAYPIAKALSAYAGCTTFTIARERVAEVRQRLATEKNLLRFLISEEVKRPAPEMRARKPHYGAAHAPGEQTAGPAAAPAVPFTPQAPKEEDAVRIAELDKQLEEVLGKANPMSEARLPDGQASGARH